MFGTAIIFDMDGTISDHSHRQHHAKNREWDDYNSKMYHDCPNHGVVEMLRAMIQRGHKIIICTARSEVYRVETVAWLQKHEIEFDRLLMRPAGIEHWSQSDVVIKREMLSQISEDILFVVEDRETVVAMWREEGLLVLQCAEGKY